MKDYQIKLVGYDLLGENGNDGVRFAWNYGDRPHYVESAAFGQNTKISEGNTGISGYTTSVTAGCVLRTMNVACRFCRTGITIPFSGFLTSRDIAKENVMMVLADMYCNDHAGLKNNKREFAYMGQGEPGYSYTQIREAIKITDMVMEELGESVHRHIIATSGIPELVEAYKDDLRNGFFKKRVTFHFSLHATNKRSFIMPIDKVYGFEQVLSSMKEIVTITGEKPCVGIMLFKNYYPRGIFDSYSNDITTMTRIAESLDPNTVRVSLCEFNSASETGTSDILNYEDSYDLLDVFLSRGFEAKLFSSYGREKNTACGMLGAKKPEHQIKEKWKKLEIRAEELVNRFSNDSR